MQNEKLNLLMMMAKIPGLAGLDIPIESLATDAEFLALSDEMMAAVNAEFHTEVVFDYC